jgi:hypothetical protein
MGQPWKKSGGIPTSQLLMAGGALAAALAIVGAYFYLSQSKAPPLNKTTFCPPVVNNVVAVLIDTSDELTVIQKLEIRNRLDVVKRDLPKHARLDLYGMGANGSSVPEPLFSMCNPGSGATADALTENARLMQNKYQKGFVEILDRHLSKLMSAKSAKQSPLMETIKAVAVQSFNTVNSTSASEKSLIVVSDMIQHSPPDYSQFKGIAKDEFVAVQKTPWFAKVFTELRSVDATLIYIQRPTQKNVQGNAHKQFWELYFSYAGGRLAHFIPI